MYENKEIDIMIFSWKSKKYRHDKLWIKPILVTTEKWLLNFSKTNQQVTYLGVVIVLMTCPKTENGGFAKNKLLVVLKILYSLSHVRFDKIVNDGCEPADRRLAGDWLSIERMSTIDIIIILLGNFIVTFADKTSCHFISFFVFADPRQEK